MTNTGDGSAAPRFPDQCAKHQDHPNAGADFEPCRGCMKASEAYEAAQDRAARRRPDWCGRCDEETRQLDDVDGIRRCPTCHPLARPVLAGATS
jgi:hypothetical protein